MEKLVELLNEYWKWSFELEIDDDTWEPTWWIVDAHQDTFEVTSYYITMQIISKRFWFIERLVKNDKINFVKKNEDWLEFNWQIMNDCMDLFDDYPVYMNTWELSDDCTDMLIMVLSIQDNPIEYLCSILEE